MFHGHIFVGIINKKEENEKYSFNNIIDCVIDNYIIGFFISRDQDISQCKYQPGNKVRSVLSNDAGIVLDKRYIRTRGKIICSYDVRFFMKSQITKTRLINHDGPIENSTLTRINNIREFELKPF